MIHFEQELEGLKQKLLVMAALAENSVCNSVKAYRLKDIAIAEKNIQEDCLLDDLEIEIDDLSVRLLAKAPLASQLRLITVGMKVSRDLERVGDEATTISRRVIKISRGSTPFDTPEICRMEEEAVNMLHDAINCFVRLDPNQARQIIPRDKSVDAMNKQLHSDMAAHMAGNPDDIPFCLNVMVISKSLERIADHAKNIAEDVVFLSEGLEIRHGRNTDVKVEIKK